MSRRRQLKVLITGLAAVSAVIVADKVDAAAPQNELQAKVERIAPPYPTLPAKVLCSCPQNGFIPRAVGYLNSVVSDHGTYKTVDVWCAYSGFLMDGEAAF